MWRGSARDAADAGRRERCGLDSCRPIRPPRGRPSVPRRAASRKRACRYSDSAPRRSGAVTRSPRRARRTDCCCRNRRSIDAIPKPIGCCVSTSTRRMVPGAKCCSRVRSLLRLRTGTGNLRNRQIRGGAERDQRPAIVDELPSAPRRRRRRFRRDTRAGSSLAVFPSMIDARLLIRQDDRVVLLAQSAPALISALCRRVERKPYCSSTQRVQPSSMLPPFQVSYIAIRGALIATPAGLVATDAPRECTAVNP